MGQSSWSPEDFDTTITVRFRDAAISLTLQPARSAYNPISSMLDQIASRHVHDALCDKIAAEAQRLMALPEDQR